MQFTFEYGTITVTTQTEEDSLRGMEERYCSAKRTATKKLQFDPHITDVVRRLETLKRLSLNYRYCEHATRDAQAALKSRREQLKLRLADTHDSIHDTEERLEKTKHGSKRLTGRLNTLKKTHRILQKLVSGDMKTKTVFGGKKLLTALAEGKATRQEWHEARNGQLYSVGQANQQGNANIRIDGDRIGINIPHPIEPRRRKDRTYHVKNSRQWFNL